MNITEEKVPGPNDPQIGYGIRGARPKAFIKNDGPGYTFSEVCFTFFFKNAQSEHHRAAANLTTGGIYQFTAATSGECIGIFCCAFATISSEGTNENSEAFSFPTRLLSGRTPYRGLDSGHYLQYGFSVSENLREQPYLIQMPNGASTLGEHSINYNIAGTLVPIGQAHVQTNSASKRFIYFWFIGFGNEVLLYTSAAIGNAPPWPGFWAKASVGPNSSTVLQPLGSQSFVGSAAVVSFALVRTSDGKVYQITTSDISTVLSVQLLAS